MSKEQDEELIEILEPHYWNMGFKEGGEARNAVLSSQTYKNLKARDERIKQEAYKQNHANATYSPYVDTFTYWDACIQDKNTVPKQLHYIATKEVWFSVSEGEDGAIMHLEIKNLHTDAKPRVLKNKESETKN